MKISKLFHWLYAFLMFLPITFILPTLAYYGFNDNAVAQEYTQEEPIYYQTNEVNDINDLSIGNIYKWTDNYNPSSYIPSTYEFLFYIEKTDNLNFLPNFEHVSGIRFLITLTGNVNLYTTYDDNSNAISYTLNNVYVDFVIKSYEAQFSSASHIVSHIQSSSMLIVKEYQEVTYTMGITESVNQAIIDTFDLPMFSWATNNILVAPFSSICSFFGIASTSVLIKYLYYWLTISVIWLVFDVLMYIPLLVHNYIDKARIE